MLVLHTSPLLSRVTRLTMRSAVPALSMAFCIALSACAEHGEGGESASWRAGAGAYPFRYDSLRLAESEDVYLGQPNTLVVVPADAGDGRLGEVWVSDFYSNSIFQFDDHGTLLGRIGSPGSGPEEFTAVTLIFLTDDGELGAVDHRRREIKWFDRQSGEFQRMVRFEAGQIGRSPPLTIEGNTRALLFPLFSLPTRTSLGLLNLDSQEWTHMGPFPRPYRNSIERGRGTRAGMFPVVHLDRLGGTAVMVAFSAVDTLYRFDLRDRSVKPLGGIPRMHRRGIEGECWSVYEGLSENRAGCGRFAFEQFSAMTRAWVLPGGRFATVHVDYHYEGEPPSVVATGSGYLTVLDSVADAACVDLPLPGGDDAHATFGLANDVLYVLDRRVTDVTAEAWLLELPIPAMAECPESHRVRGWRVSDGG